MRRRNKNIDVRRNAHLNSIKPSVSMHPADATIFGDTAALAGRALYSSSVIKTRFNSTAWMRPRETANSWIENANDRWLMRPARDLIGKTGAARED
jgi:hypothetical protein